MPRTTSWTSAAGNSYGTVSMGTEANDHGDTLLLVNHSSTSVMHCAQPALLEAVLVSVMVSIDSDEKSRIACQ